MNEFVELIQPDAPDWLTEANESAVKLVEQHQLPAAVVTFRRILAIDPTRAVVWSNLGSALWSLRLYDEALDALKRSLELCPNFPLALSNLGMVYEGMRQLDLAEMALDQAIAADPNYLNARWNRAVLRMGNGDWEGGLPDYETRIDRRPDLYPDRSMPRWQGESLKGKSIHVEAEMGVGDTIFFARFLPWLATQADKVYFCCTLLVTQLLWEYRECVTFLPMQVPLPPADYCVFVGSLPRWYGLCQENIPPDPGYIRQRVTKAGPVIRLPEPTSSPALKVGICWTGNAAFERNDERTVPFNLLMTIAEEPRVWLYSLQAGSASREIAAAGADGLVYQFEQELQVSGFVGTGSAILQCDLVVTCCTSIAHLAGALGVPCWLLLCRDPYWIWGQDDSVDTPWYPSIRLFRQRASGDWKQVIADVRFALSEMLND